MDGWKLARRMLVTCIAAFAVTAAIAVEPGIDPEIARAQSELDAAFSRYTRFATEGGGDVDQARDDYREAKARLQSLQVQSAAGSTGPAETAVAAYRRGLAAYAGTQGKVDKALAAREFEAAARAGHPKAQYNLGRMLWSGDGVARDVRGAVHWMQRAAESGEANAQFVLAQALEAGTGIPRDAASGRQWLERAAAGGEPLAQRELGTRLLEGRGMPVDVERGQRLIAQADAGGGVLVEAPLKPATAGRSAKERPVVLAALQEMFDAQSRGDVAAMTATLATAHLAGTERQVLDRVLARTVGRMRLADLEWRPLAVGVNGEWALVRYQYQLTAVIGRERLPQAGGSVAVLVREASGWKVLQILVDEDLTLATFDSVGEPLALRARPSSGQAACAAPKRPGLVTPENYFEALSHCIDDWFVDAGKIKRDTIFSAAGKIPIAGDLVSNAYTFYERMRGLFVELPADLRAGHADVVFLDLSLIGCGALQIWTEVLPGVDHATDTLEGFVDQARYNQIQRHNYLSLLKQLEKQDFKSMPKYLVQRFTSKRQFELARTQLHLGTEANWHSRWRALRRIDVLSDAFLRSDPDLVFDVAAELTIDQSENANAFQAATDLGFRSNGGIVYVPLDLTALVVADESRGDDVLGPLDRRSRRGHLSYRLSCMRGERELSVRLNDATKTVPVRVRNLPFNLIRGARLVGGSFDQATGAELAVGTIHSGIRVEALLDAAEPGLTVTPPEILKSSCVHHRQLQPEVLGVETVGEWPSMSLTLVPLRAGASTLEFHFDAATSLPALVVPVTVNVIDPTAPPKPVLDGDWNIELTVVATTRKPVKRPQTEEERRIARDQLGLSEPAKVPQPGDRVVTRARVAGNLIEIWDTDNAQWTIFMRFRSEGAPAQLRLYSIDVEGMQLTGNAQALSGEYEIRDDGGTDRFRVRMTR